MKNLLSHIVHDHCSNIDFSFSRFQNAKIWDCCRCYESSWSAADQKETLSVPSEQQLFCPHQNKSQLLAAQDVSTALLHAQVPPTAHSKRIIPLSLAYRTFFWHLNLATSLSWNYSQPPAHPCPISWSTPLPQPPSPALSLNTLLTLLMVSSLAPHGQLSNSLRILFSDDRPPSKVFEHFSLCLQAHARTDIQQPTRHTERLYSSPQSLAIQHTSRELL